MCGNTSHEHNVHSSHVYLCHFILKHMRNLEWNGFGITPSSIPMVAVQVLTGCNLHWWSFSSAIERLYFLAHVVVQMVRVLLWAHCNLYWWSFSMTNWCRYSTGTAGGGGCDIATCTGGGGIYSTSYTILG